ncbi:protein SPT2 homolog [Mangifera indica]|uniref:protein SPT2 homolog n=1 Tax=Mangifera indica TaxID=29780 RepID=UPI001CF9CA69|nr:protein SPT2 homolog [Mangifera indica]
MDPSSFFHLSTDSLHLHHHPPPPPTSATIANPTPPSLNHNKSNHPPYTEMISSAIATLKEKDGSSKRAIAKFIEKVYGNFLPPNHSALLTHHLKRLRNTGQLIMVKKSYKLPRSDDEVSASIIPSESNNIIPDNAPAISSAHGPKTGRGRGRPPKANNSTDGVLASLGLVDQPKSGPGRPKKGDVVVVTMTATQGPKKGRGRPPKAKKRGPGRPKKPKSVLGKLGPGRPPKVKAQAPGLEQLNNPVAVTYVPSDASVPGAVADVAKPRKRPKKIGTTLGGGGGGVDQLGQPPKKGVSSSGRPVGRPKKNPSGALTETGGAAAIGDLKRKLELFQTKLRQAISVLKPHLSSESQISAVAAIQELEALAVMDIGTPLQEVTQVAQPPLPPPAPQQQQQQSR